METEKTNVRNFWLTTKSQKAKVIRVAKRKGVKESVIIRNLIDSLKDEKVSIKKRK